MRLIINLLLVFTFSLSKAQSSNTVARTEEYVMMISNEKTLGNFDMHFSVDYGEDLPLTTTESMVKEENKKLKQFKKIVDVLNYMNSKGWVYLSTYQMTYNSGSYYHYLLKRPVKSN